MFPNADSGSQNMVLGLRLVVFPGNLEISTFRFHLRPTKSEILGNSEMYALVEPSGVSDRYYSLKTSDLVLHVKVFSALIYYGEDVGYHG